jgi:hypothetical protein
VDECYSLLLGSSQRANELAGLRSRDVFSIGQASALDSEHVTCVLCDACPCCIYISDQNSEAETVTRVEAGSNISTVTLRVVGGNEKGSLKSETVK